MLGRRVWGLGRPGDSTVADRCFVAIANRITAHVGSRTCPDDQCGFEEVAMRAGNRLDHRSGHRTRVVLSVKALVPRPIFVDLGTVLQIQIVPR